MSGGGFPRIRTACLGLLPSMFCVSLLTPKHDDVFAGAIVGRPVIDA